MRDWIATLTPTTTASAPARTWESSARFPCVDAVASVEEMARSRQVHRDSGLLRGLDDELLAHRPAGLDDGADAGLDQHLEPVGEREERVGRGDRAGGALPRTGDGELGRVDAVDLTH